MVGPTEVDLQWKMVYFRLIVSVDVLAAFIITTVACACFHNLSTHCIAYVHYGWPGRVNKNFPLHLPSVFSKI